MSKIRLATDREATYMRIAMEVAKLTNCERRQVGAVLVLDNRIISTGYNGTPRNVAHCEQYPCPRFAQNKAAGSTAENCIAVHAEMNAILNCQLPATQLRGAHLYCTHSPCTSCASMIIQVGISKVAYLERYPDEFAHAYLMKYVALEQASIIPGKENEHGRQ